MEDILIPHEPILGTVALLIPILVCDRGPI